MKVKNYELMSKWEFRLVLLSFTLALVGIGLLGVHSSNLNPLGLILMVGGTTLVVVICFRFKLRMDAAAEAASDRETRIRMGLRVDPEPGTPLLPDG